MGQVGFCKYFCSGEQVFPKEKLRSSYAADQTECLQGSDSFKGEIQFEESDNKKIVTIDNAIKVSTVTDKVRADAVKYLDDTKSNFTKLADKFRITEISLDLSAGVLVGASILCGFALPVLWPIAVALVALAVVILGISLLAEKRSNQASNQAYLLGKEKQEWNDPIPGLQEKRKKIEAAGFTYAYANALRGKLITTAELKNLFKTEIKNFKKLMDDAAALPDQNKIKLRDDFINSPLYKAISSEKNYKEFFGEENVDAEFQPLINAMVKLQERRTEFTKTVAKFSSEVAKGHDEVKSEVTAKALAWDEFVIQSFQEMRNSRVTNRRNYVVNVVEYNVVQGVFDPYVIPVNRVSYYDLTDSALSTLRQGGFDWKARKVNEIQRNQNAVMQQTHIQDDALKVKTFEDFRNIFGAFEANQPQAALEGFNPNLVVPNIGLNIMFEWVEPAYNAHLSQVIGQRDWTDLMNKCRAKAFELNPALG